MGFKIDVDGTSVHVTQDDTAGMSDTSVQFTLNGPPGGRDIVWNSMGRFTLTDLVDGDYELKRARYGDKETEYQTAHFTLPVPTKLPDPPKKETKASKKASKK